MNFKIIYGMVIGLMVLTSCCSGAESPKIEPDSLQEKKVLIIYLSRTKNTKTVAEMIHQQTGGQLVELELATPYPDKYQKHVDQARKENETGVLPKLKTKIEDIEKYDVIFIGFPTWGMQLPPPMKSFLTVHNLSGKTVVPFNTNAGYGLGSSIKTIKSLCQNSTVLEEFSVEGGKERDGILFVMKEKKEQEVRAELKAWLQKLGFVG